RDGHFGIAVQTGRSLLRLQARRYSDRGTRWDRMVGVGRPRYHSVPACRRAGRAHRRGRAVPMMASGWGHDLADFVDRFVAEDNQEVELRSALKSLADDQWPAAYALLSVRLDGLKSALLPVAFHPATDDPVHPTIVTPELFKAF